MVQPLSKTVLCFLSKLKMELPYDPTYALLSPFLKKMQTGVQRMHVSSDALHGRQKVKMHVPMNGLMGKPTAVQLCHGIVLSHEEEPHRDPATTWASREDSRVNA